MACTIPYIQREQLSETEKARLEGVHMDIINEAKASGGFRKDGKQLVTGKQTYAKATQFLASTLNKYKAKVVSLPEIGGGKHALNINVLPLAGEKQEDLFLNKEHAVNKTLASESTINLVKDLLENMGISVQDLQTYAKETGFDTTSVAGVADLSRNVIALAEGEEAAALTEEMVHLATYFLEYKNPKMITEMISKIDRFKIYKEVFEAYKSNPNYLLSDGKPNIRKIKKEAVDKLITEVIINQNENIDNYPELREEINQSWVRKIWSDVLDWIRGEYRKSNISLFEKAAKDIVSGEAANEEIVAIRNSSSEVFLQLSNKQQDIQNKILDTKNILKKVTVKEKTDPLLLDSEEATNHYELKKEDGTWEKVTKRVTDRVKEWYKKQRFGRVFTKEEQAFNELKREKGVLGHADFEEIHARYFNSDGTRKATPEPRPTKFSLEDQEMYEKLERYYTDLINQPQFKDALIFSEVLIYDPKQKEAGTIDFLAIEPSGKAHILDWKFMHITGDDVAWFKQGAFGIQIGTYAHILKQEYGVKEFGMKRAIPISMSFKHEKTGDKNTPLVLSGIAVGSADARQIEDIRLIPISEPGESTGFDALDRIISQLNALLEQIGKETASDDQEREFKIERLNTLRRAIKYAQGTLDMSHLVDYIDLMKREGEQILSDYNTIYKNRPARSTDSTDSELSEFSDEMNSFIQTASIFSNIHREIGHLVFTEDMLKNAKTEEEKKSAQSRKDQLQKLNDQSNSIDSSLRDINKAALSFADKHIGERNLVTGLLKPEKVVKGLASMFRGVADIGLKSLDILTKLTAAAQSKASADAKEEVNTLMIIREKLAKQGGDLRRLVQQIYQKDDKGNLVNKLIYKYSREFHNTVDEKAMKGGSLEWLKSNIDMEAYKAEAKILIKKRIEKINKNLYKGTDEQVKEQKERLIKQVTAQFDIEHESFSGWSNYIIKRHPLQKWYSEEYKNIQKNPELLELYNFIVAFNEKAKDVGYIDNQVMKNFLPWVRKSMAEEIVWNNRLSIMDNFYKSVQLNPDDTGYGKINQITGQLENGIPKYYTNDFTKKDGVNDFSDVSEDLFKNLILYVQHVNKYKYMSEVEGQLKLVKTIEQFKDHLNTNRVGEVIIKNGKPEKVTGNAENAKLFDDFLRVLLYEQKYVLSDVDTPLGVDKVIAGVKRLVNKTAGKEVWKENENATATSLHKSMDSINRGFQLKTLGFEFISGAVNWFGSNIQVATQAGNYFKAREFAKNEAKLTMQKFDSEDDKEIFAQLVNTFMPLKDDPSYQAFKDAGMNILTRTSMSDTLMVFMREPEILVEKAIFLTLLENTMVVDGKIVSINEYVKSKYAGRLDSSAAYRESKAKIEAEVAELKREKSIASTRKLEDGKLVIPGLDLTNREELQRLTNLSRRLSTNATGNMTKDATNRMSMSIWTKSMMVFKNWIPKLADTRFSEFKRVADDFSVRINEDGIAEGEKYDIGRIRLLAYVLGFNFIKGAQDLNNIIALNDKGLATLDQMLDDFREKYEAETGEVLQISREQFIELIRTNLRNQLKELAILASLFGVALSLGFVAPDDDDADKATKNLHRYAQRVVDKFVSELSFFYNPAELESILSGGIFPAVGLVNDMARFMSHFFRETTGFDLDPETSYEDVRKKALPIKHAMKIFPITKSLVTYLALIDEDWAKEMDVTIQKDNR